MRGDRIMERRKKWLSGRGEGSKLWGRKRLGCVSAGGRKEEERNNNKNEIKIIFLTREHALLSFSYSFHPSSFPLSLTQTLVNISWGVISGYRVLPCPLTEATKYKWAIQNAAQAEEYDHYRLSGLGFRPSPPSSAVIVKRSYSWPLLAPQALFK
jgi:hypothetical protein